MVRNIMLLYLIRQFSQACHPAGQVGTEPAMQNSYIRKDKKINLRIIIKNCAASLIFCTLVLTQQAKAQFIRDAEIENLLLDYSKPIFLAAGLKPDEVHIGIINNKRLNAFVAGGKNMYFHTGLILEADTPNVVIGVIAHETGHIVGGHLARTGDALAKASRPMLLATILGVGALAAGQADAGMALITGGQQIAKGSFLSFSRAQEASADQIALRLLEKTEQSARGIRDMMDDLADQDALSGVHQDPYVRSHPLSRNRVNFLEQGMKASAFTDREDSPALQFRHDMAKAKIYGFLDHPGTTLRRYAKQNTLPARYARAIALYKNGETSRAVQLVDKLIAYQPTNPYFHELKGQILYEAGRLTESIAPYRQSVALAPDEPLLQIGLATSLLSLETKASAEEALSILKKALRMEEDNMTAYYQMATAHALLGDTGRAELATAERYYILGHQQKASTHARRAMKFLPANTPEWLKAQDIMAKP